MNPIAGGKQSRHELYWVLLEWYDEQRIGNCLYNKSTLILTGYTSMDCNVYLQCPERVICTINKTLLVLSQIFVHMFLKNSETSKISIFVDSTIYA